MSTITCSGGTERNQLACMQLAIKAWWANTRGCLARHSAVINGSGEGLPQHGSLPHKAPFRQQNNSQDPLEGPRGPALSPNMLSVFGPSA